MSTDRACANRRWGAQIRMNLLAGCAALAFGGLVSAQDLPPEDSNLLHVRSLTTGYTTTDFYWESGTGFGTPNGRCLQRRVQTVAFYGTVIYDSGYQATGPGDCGYDSQGEVVPDFDPAGPDQYGRDPGRGTKTADCLSPLYFATCTEPLAPSNRPLQSRGRKTRPGLAAAPETRPEIVRWDGVPDTQTLDTENTFSNVVFIDIQTPTGGGSCTGTLINQRQVLTAAHCFPDAEAYIVRVSFDPDAQGGFFDAMSVTLNSEFTFSSGQSDVAIITLATSALLVDPVRLDDAQGSAIQIGAELTIVGYGTSGVGSQGATINDFRRRFGHNTLDVVGTLRQAGLFTDPVSAPISIDETFIMADFDAPGAAPPAGTGPGEVITSTGDSGGPAFVMTDTGLVQVGITSFGLFGYNGRSGSYNAITLFQPVFEHIAWIEGLNPFIRATALAGDGDWSDVGHWRDGAVPLSDLPGTYTAVSTDYDAPDLFEVHLTEAGTTTVTDFAYVDSLTIAGSAGLHIAADAQMWLDTGLGQAGGETVVDGVLVSQTMQLAGGSFLIGATGEYYDPSPYYSEGIYQLGADFRVDGLVTTDWFYQSGGATHIGDTGQFFDWEGSFVEGGTLLVDGVLDTFSFAQTGGSTRIGAGGLLFDATGYSFIENARFEIDGTFDTLQALVLNSALGGDGVIYAPGGVQQVGGVMRPGTSLAGAGSLAIDGDYVSSDVVFSIGIGETGTTALQVSGHAVLDGVLGVSFEPGFQPTRNTRHVFVSTGSGLDISGLLLANSQISPVLSMQLTGSGLEASIRIEALDYAGFAETDQQRAVAVALGEALADTVPQGALGEVANSLDHLASTAELRDALQTANPTDTFSLDRFGSGLSRSLGETVTARTRLFASGRHGGSGGTAQQPVQLASADAGSATLLAALRSATNADAETQHDRLNDRTGVFMSSRVERGDTELPNGTMDIEATHLAVGMDYDLGGQWLIGATGGFSDYSAGRSTARTVGQAVTFSGYAAYASETVYAHLYVGGGQADFDLSRTITTGDVNRLALADAEADYWLAGAEAGARFDHRGWTSGPVLSIRHSDATFARYEETGAGGFNATVAARDSDQTLVGLGWRAQTERTLTIGQLALNGELGWRQDISPGDSLAEASIEAAPGATFLVLDNSHDDGFATAAIGASLQASDRTAISVGLSHDFDRASDSAQSLNFAMSWRF